MSDDLNDLLGDSAAPDLYVPPPSAPRKRGRPTREEAAAKLAAQAEGNDGKIALPDTSMFYTPVGITFLASVFRMQPRTAMKKLMKCPVLEYKAGVGTKGKEVPHYDFVTAAAYLIDPKVDLVQYLTSLNSNNIPPHINKTFWDAMNAKAKWQANARQTWRDEDVLQVLGQTAIKIREVSLLWIDQLPDKVSISDENHKAMRAAVADLLQQIKISLEDMPKERRTESVISTMEAELGEEDSGNYANFDFDDDVDAREELLG